jgi:hypothetical protein
VIFVYVLFIYYEELAHDIMEAENSHGPLFESW